MTIATLDENELSKWIGKSETISDTIDVRPARLMQAILERKPDMSIGELLPPLWHWLYFPTLSPLSALGADGHPRLGGFLPPVALPRRMWAGGRFKFERVLRIGDEVEKISTINNVVVKKGRTGDLCFVTVLHEYKVAGERRLCEEHDIVYRENPSPHDRAPIPPKPSIEASWQRAIEPSPVMLFRYSALTFNGHRIHYDRDYCREVEGYEGLVFHGPLMATFLVDLACENNPKEWIQSFEFRSISPLFDTEPFQISGHRKADIAELWVTNAKGRLAMKAKARFE